MSRQPNELANIMAVIERYRSAGYEFFPLRGKKPVHKGWRERDYSSFDPAPWIEQGDNVGIRLRADDLIIDCDPRNYQPGDDPLRRLAEAVSAPLRDAPATITGSGGLHLFFRKPPGLRIVGKLAGYDGLDILTEGKFIVAPGSIHPETFLDYKADGDIRAVQMAPDALLELLARPERAESRGEPGVIEPDELALLLKALDPRKYGQGKYADWIALSAACHDATNGYGLVEWLEWCAEDPDYDNVPAMERAEATWGSFKAGRSGGATCRTLFKAVIDAGRGDLLNQLRFEQGLDELWDQKLDFDDLPEPLKLDLTMIDEFAALFEIDASRRAELYDDKGRPTLLAKLKHADRKRFEQLMFLYKDRRIADLRSLKQEVDGLTRAAEKAADAKAKTSKVCAGEFRTTKEGVVVASDPDNIVLAISKLKVRLRYDEFRGWPIVEGLKGFDGALDDAAMNRLWLTVQREFDFRPALQLFQIVVSDTCRLNSFHPVRNYLDGLEWDGVKRLDDWLIRYCGANDTLFHRAVSRICLIAAVRRVRQPGIKFDNLIVLEGPEGISKSVMLAILARRDEWFTDSVPLSIDDKRMIESTSGRWIAEFGELTGIRTGEVEKIKAQLSRQTDRARLAYGKLPVEVKRQFIGFGTTNNGQYLAGLTGNRRFWPVEVKRIDIKAFNLIVDQLWAEASLREATGDSIVLDEKLWPAAAEQQAKRELVNPFLEPLAEALGDREGYIFMADLFKLLGIDAGRQNQHDFNRVGKAMNALGFDKIQKRLGALRSTAYQKGGTDRRLQPIRQEHRWVLSSWTQQDESDDLEPECSET